MNPPPRAWSAYTTLVDGVGDPLEDARKATVSGCPSLGLEGQSLSQASPLSWIKRCYCCCYTEDLTSQSNPVLSQATCFLGNNNSSNIYFSPTQLLNNTMPVFHEGISMCLELGLHVRLLLWLEGQPHLAGFRKRNPLASCQDGQVYRGSIDTS